MKELRPALLSLVVFTLLCGVAYPLAVTGIAQLAFPGPANGSLITDADGEVRGSALIAQGFTRVDYFWPRPSAAGEGYDAMASSGSNCGVSHPDLATAFRDRIAALHAADPTNPLAIPVDLVTASASGLDPDITPAAAYYQVARVAKARGVAPGVVKKLVDAHIAVRLAGIIGEPTVNVLLLNRALDAR